MLPVLPLVQWSIRQAPRIQENANVTNNNPLSPRNTGTMKRFTNTNSVGNFKSPGKHSQIRKNSKVMKKYYEDTKGYRSSRNLEMTKRMHNNTQLIPFSSGSRNTSSNVVLNNLSATSRLKKSFKNSITSKSQIFVLSIIYKVAA